MAVKREAARNKFFVFISLFSCGQDGTSRNVLIGFRPLVDARAVEILRRVYHNEKFANFVDRIPVKLQGANVRIDIVVPVVAIPIWPFPGIIRSKQIRSPRGNWIGYQTALAVIRRLMPVTAGNRFGAHLKLGVVMQIRIDAVRRAPQVRCAGLGVVRRDLI